MNWKYISKRISCGGELILNGNVEREGEKINVRVKLEFLKICRVKEHVFPYRVKFPRMKYEARLQMRSSSKDD